MLKHWKFDQEDMCLLLLDQRLLPEKMEWISCHKWQEAVNAIQNMVIRGAPAIGVAAAWTCVLAAKEAQTKRDWRTWLNETLEKIAKARPTAVNLAWAVARMRKEIAEAQDLQELLKKWLLLAEEISAEDEEICRQIGQQGQILIKDGDCILTHCNAGSLATAGYGTALGVIRAAHEAGKKINVIADETRPLFQGARLTAFELAQDEIPVTVACDNACATLMAKGLVQLVITGADRIAANGDTANKIGTFGIAIMAKYFNIPFYIAAPLSTFDMNLAQGKDIPIETRKADEVIIIGGQRIVPENVPVYNYAFDVTPADLISGIVTEAGIIRPPYQESITQLFAEAEKS